LQAESLSKIVEMDSAAVTADEDSQASEESEAGDLDVNEELAVASKEKQGSDFSLLRLATLDRKRRREQEIDRLVRKAARSGDGCGCGHEHA
jgi:TFIIF-interacting CTD phosphatase-like protein